jgi:hypothetical protein
VVAVLLDKQYTRRGSRAQICLRRQGPAQKYQAAEDRSVRMPGRGIDVLFPQQALRRTFHSCRSPSSTVPLKGLVSKRRTPYSLKEPLVPDS